MVLNMIVIDFVITVMVGPVRSGLSELHMSRLYALLRKYKIQKQKKKLIRLLKQENLIFFINFFSQTYDASIFKCWISNAVLV